MNANGPCDFITLFQFAFAVRISLDFSELIVKFHTFLLFCYHNLFLILCKTRVLFPPAQQYSTVAYICDNLRVQHLWKNKNWNSFTIMPKVVAEGTNCY